MFDQIFLLPQVKRNAIITIRLALRLAERLKIRKNQENLKICCQNYKVLSSLPAKMIFFSILGKNFLREFVSDTLRMIVEFISNFLSMIVSGNNLLLLSRPRLLKTLHKKMKFSIKDFFSKCDQICSFLKADLSDNFGNFKVFDLVLT